MSGKRKYPKEWDKEIIVQILRDLDDHLVQRRERASVIAIGGVVIVLQDFQLRSTNDLDMAPVSGADCLLKACSRLGINAQVVTLASTVDFQEVETIRLFSGKALTLDGVGAEDLIRLKLERFRKHDPEDIYAIIQKEKFPYEKFAAIIREGKIDFVGRTEEYLLSAQLVVERMYPDRLKDFKGSFKLA